MDKGFLIEILEMYRNNEQTLESTLRAIDEYRDEAVKNLQQPAVSGSALHKFINEHLERSRPTCTEDNPFMMGWVAGLIHVRCNWLNRQSGCEHYR